MIYDYLKRGVLAGVVAGLAYGLYIALVANPLLEYVHEAGHDHGHGHEHSHGHDHSHAVSETTNAVVSVGSAVLWGILLAGLFALAYYFLEPAIPGPDDLKAYVLAGAGFLTVSGIPWLVLPPAAPGAEYALGVDVRLGIYVTLMGVGALTVTGSAVAYRRLVPKGRSIAFAGGALPLVLVGTLLLVSSPTIITHPDLSGELVTAFQGTAVLAQLALWALVAGVFSRLHADSRGNAVTADDLEEPIATA